MQASSQPITLLLAAGSNAVGQLGNGTTVDSFVFAPCMFQKPANPDNRLLSARCDPFIVQDIAAGGRHTLVLVGCGGGTSSNTELWGCGDGSRGQLGPQYLQSDVAGSSSSTSVLRPIELPLEILQEGYSYRLIACSWETSYVVFSCPGRNDILVSMGADDFGNLGTTYTTRTTQKDQIPIHRVDFHHVLPNDAVRLVVTCLSAGLYHIIVQLKATLADGSVRDLTVGWGMSRHGQLGQSSVSSGIVKSPRLVSLVDADAHDPIISISSGNHHIVFLHDSGRVSGLGSNKKNQLRSIDNQKDVRAFGCSWNGTYIVTGYGAESRILSAGSHSKGQLGRCIPDNTQASLLGPVQFPFPSSTHRFVSMACGSEHVLILFDVASQVTPGETTKEIWGWGWNEHGNLGTGTNEDVVLPRRLWPNTLKKSSSREDVVGIWAGCATSWIVVTVESCLF